MIPIRILSDDDVKRILDIRSTIESVEKAYVMKVSNKARLFPLISEDLLPGTSDMDIKSGLLSEENVFGLKLVAWFGENIKKDLPALTSLSMLLDLKTGFPKAIINASYLTGLRTGAAGAIGIKYLSKQNSKVLFVVGTGAQAVFQIAAALSAVESIEKVYLFNPMRYESAIKLQSSIKENVKEIVNDFKDPDNKNWHKRLESVEFIATNNPVEALGETDAVITITPSRKPLILKEWVHPGMHFSCIGADLCGKQELDEKIFDNAIVFVDDIVQATTVGEIQNPIKGGNLCMDQLTEIGYLILKNSVGRQSDKDITVFDSTGIALQDLAVSNYLLEKAEKMNLGTIIQI